MSVIRTIALNFSDGIHTQYRTTANIYIPFLCSNIVVRQTILDIDNPSYTATISCNNLVQNGSSCLSQTKAFTSGYPLTHLYSSPRQINGLYSFELTLSTISDLTVCNVALLIEFNEQFKLFRNLKIINADYFVWRFANTAASSQYIDIRYPVNEIQICQVDTLPPSFTLTGVYSDLVYSSASPNDVNNGCLINPLYNIELGTVDVQNHKIVYKYPQPRMISGIFRVWMSELLTGDIVPMSQTVIILRFIQYQF